MNTYKIKLFKKLKLKRVAGCLCYTNKWCIVGCLMVASGNAVVAFVNY